MAKVQSQTGKNDWLILRFGPRIWEIGDPSRLSDIHIYTKEVKAQEGQVTALRLHS